MLKKLILLALISTSANSAVIDCKLNTCVNTSTGGSDIFYNVNPVTPVVTKPAYYDPDSMELEMPRVCVWRDCYDQVTIKINSGYQLKRLNGVVVK
jgi:hypothetical protein